MLPYKRPMTKEGFFKKYEYVYDEYYDCYICPEEGDHRADLRDCERAARVPLYTIHRKGTDGDERRAHLCVHELKETGKDPC